MKNETKGRGYCSKKWNNIPVPLFHSYIRIILKINILQKTILKSNQNITTTYILLYNKKEHKVYHSKEVLSALFGDVNIKNISMPGRDKHSFYWLINKTFSPTEIEKINKSKILFSKDKAYLANRQEDENPFLLQFK